MEGTSGQVSGTEAKDKKKAGKESEATSSKVSDTTSRYSLSKILRPR